jgi:hypothetical protein
MSIRDSDLKSPERIYGLLLFLYPPGFRGRFGPEMLQVFADSYPDRGWYSGFPTSLFFWYATVSDLVRSLPGEWRQALIRPRKIELPFGRWADSLVIPFTVFGYLMVEGNLGATLVRPSSACGDTWRWVCMASTGTAIALTLGVLGILSAAITRRNRRAEIWSIKL